MDGMKVIAHIYTDFDEKFGIPRQSGIVEASRGRIVFEPEYRNEDALLGIEGYSHLWLVWKFSKSVRDGWSATVRPPRLGGNKRMGVFATRSPFRPNPIGLSSVRLLEVRHGTENGAELIVSGVDMLSGTPVYDIKPYLAYTDSHADAVGGFADEVMEYKVQVNIPADIEEKIIADGHYELKELLAQDPRPGYKNEAEDSRRVYGMSYAGHNVKFTVSEGVLTVVAYESI